MSCRSLPKRRWTTSSLITATALAAIEGGYSFSVTISDSNWSRTRVFDGGGVLESTTDFADSDGVITSKVTVHADQSTSNSEIYKAGIIAQEVTVEPDGSRNTKTYDATGSLVSEAVKNSDGSSSSTLYSGDVKTKMYVANSDGSHDT